MLAKPATPTTHGFAACDTAASHRTSQSSHLPSALVRARTTFSWGGHTELYSSRYPHKHVAYFMQSFSYTD